MEENLQVENTSVEQNQVEQPNAYIAPSEAEYKKAIQSASSKAKYELLQEMGVKSVDEFKNKYSEYTSAIEENKSLKNERSAYQSQITELNQNLVLAKLNVSDEYKSDLITLAQSKVTGEVDFEAAARQVLEKNPAWKTFNQTEAVKIGTEKAEAKVEEQGVSTFLKAKYPWLH